MMEKHIKGEEHIIHCMEQLWRFSRMFKDESVDNKSRKMQFGYNLGRLVVLLKNIDRVYGLNQNLRSYTLQMATGVIGMGLNETEHFENCQVDFGFAIGFVQESLCQNHEIWWKPISPYAEKENWNEVAKITRNILDKQNISGATHYFFPVFEWETELDWSRIFDTVVNANNVIMAEFY
ncbi:putative orfan [Tupanvirus soda lake]|uniref:Orfan n=2 Tax=Tupanvirus TaxID=2094720 RepID=A0AC62ADP0_9VIRU|nr:putative orfan [Tupanvirus soda lake]QKU35905.1 putative orfan [Tupanvirus soda lake]